jgi:RNA recognition motif-containing protein
MNSRLYVGNLAYSTTDAGLREFFEAAGEVKSAEVVIERSSGRSKGFGFVEMTTDEGAQSAINTLNGKLLDQRPIRIDFAKPKEDRPRSNGGSGGYSGGRSGSSSGSSSGYSSGGYNRSSGGSGSGSGGGDRGGNRSGGNRREGDRGRDRRRESYEDDF